LYVMRDKTNLDAEPARQRKSKHEYAVGNKDDKSFTQATDE